MHSKTPTTRHPMALTLALLIVAEKQQRKYAEGTFEDAVYEVLETCMALAEWSDHKKAALYALLAENLGAADTCMLLEQKINVYLWRVENNYHG